MSVPAALVLLMSGPYAGLADITPVSLAIDPHVVDLGDEPYDWALQRGPSASKVDLKVAQTATCDTVMSSTNNGQDTVPDCRFD